MISTQTQTPWTWTSTSDSEMEETWKIIISIWINQEKMECTLEGITQGFKVRHYPKKIFGPVCFQTHRICTVTTNIIEKPNYPHQPNRVGIHFARRTFCASHAWRDNSWKPLRNTNPLFYFEQKNSRHISTRTQAQTHFEREIKLIIKPIYGLLWMREWHE